MPDAPDPLGKRSLFWAPAQRHEGGPRRSEKRDTPGRRALFSTTDTTAGNGKKPSRTPAIAAQQPPRARPRAADATGARSGSHPTPATARRRALGPITGLELTCSKCEAHSDVDVVRFAMLHVPVWLWRPGRGYTRYMKCPSCGQRAWVSASWAPWRR